MRVVISGIGRSGTTMMYQQIGRMIREAFLGPRFRYEPYLWDLNVAYTRDSRFGQGDLSAFGMHAHQAAPLFLSGEHPVHDEFLDRILGSEVALPGDPENPDSWLVKIIRGNGRLESYLRRYPELKVVICLRNPIDTLNSSMGMFSFTGEEFHRSDAPRLLSEVSARFPHIELPEAATATKLAISAVWWRAFTEWAVSVAAAYPDRCYLFVHEQLAINQDAEIERLVRFLGFSSAQTFKTEMDGYAGPKASSSHLLACDLAELTPHLGYYLDTCIRNEIPLKRRQSLRVSLLQRYAERPFRPQLAGDSVGRRTSIQLRDALYFDSSRKSGYAQPSYDDPVRVPLRNRMIQFATSASFSLGAYKAYAPPSIARRGECTFGCAIASFNSRETIRDAVFSALDQTMPFDRIVVVDDASTDGTRNLLQEMAERYSRLTVHFRKHNGGVSLARDRAIRMLGTRFVTHLDSDDCFWPTKNREEAEVCFDDPSAIAFSPTMHDYSATRWTVMDSSGYVGSAAAAYEKLLKREPGIPSNMTLSLQAYLQAGGFDLRLPLYEDWDLKLRLAQLDAPWKISASRIGTIYNRRENRLSERGEIELARGVAHVFLKAVLRSQPMPRLAALFSAAVQQETNAAITQVIAALNLCDSGQMPLSALSTVIGRSFVALSNEDYLQQFAALTAQFSSDGSDIGATHAAQASMPASLVTTST
jgi:hypothetical protein